MKSEITDEIYKLKSLFKKKDKKDGSIKLSAVQSKALAELRKQTVDLSVEYVKTVCISNYYLQGVSKYSINKLLG